MRSALLVAPLLLAGCRSAAELTVRAGDITATVRENDPDAHPTKGPLSGLRALSWRGGPSPFGLGGLNLEHIFAGHADPRNGFTPRLGPFTLVPAGKDGAALVRHDADEPWPVSYRLTYRAVAPCYVDFELEVTVHDAQPFQPEDLIAFFLASYVGPTTDVELRFRGIPGPGQPEQWVTTRANGKDPGEHYVAVDSPGLPVDPADRNLVTNAGHEPWPRIAQPYYYGHIGEMVYGLFLDVLRTDEQEVRFTVMRWRAAEGRPAWDFTWVVRKLSDGETARLRGRLLWKPFVSAEDVTREYEAWRARLDVR